MTSEPVDPPAGGRAESRGEAPPPLPRRRVTTATIYIISVVILAAAVSLATLLVMQASDREDRGRSNVDATHLNIERLMTLQISLLDVETAQRGYLLTRDPAYLDRFQQGLNGANNVLTALKTWAGNDPARQQALTQIRALNDAKLAEVRETLELETAGKHEQAVALIRTDQGKRLMDQIRDRIDALSRAQLNDLAQANAAAVHDRRMTNFYLALVIAAGLLAVAAAGLMARRAAQVESQAYYLDQVRAERDRADLISRELAHRVKNLFAVIMSIISTTGRSETDARIAAAKVRERVQALSRAHALTTGRDALSDPDLHDLLRAVVGPYLSEGRDFTCEGPPVDLPSGTITPMGLIFNELATNALKYGGWSQPEGTVRVEWTLESRNDKPGMLHITWREGGSGGVQAPAGTGFGTTMIDASAAQARATVERAWEKGGLVLTLHVSDVRPGQERHNAGR